MPNRTKIKTENGLLYREGFKSNLSEGADFDYKGKLQKTSRIKVKLRTPEQATHT